MNKTFLLIDSPFLCWRAKYSMPQDLSYMGSPTAIIYAFLKEIVTLQNEFQTSHVIFFFDSKTSLRKEIYPEYKSNRHTKELTEEEMQFEIAFRNQMLKLRKEYLKTIGWKNVFQVKGYESDDLIAQFCSMLSKAEDKSVIITADHDLWQTIGPNVSVYNPRDKKELTYQAFKQKYGIKPRQWAVVKAMAGCGSDDVKGIKGVGEITAVKYLTGNLKSNSKIYKAIESEDGQRVIRRNLKLVRLPFEGTPEQTIVEDKLSMTGWKEIVKKLGFKSFDHTDPFPWSRQK